MYELSTNEQTIYLKDVQIRRGLRQIESARLRQKPKQKSSADVQNYQNGVKPDRVPRNESGNG